MSILFIGAHPDDIELGCGGTICYYTEKSQEVFCYYLTNGEYSDINGNPARSFEEIYTTTKKSLGTLGVKEKNFFFTDIPATELKVNKNIISELQRFIIDNNVTTLFTHPNPDTYHQDHRATHNISMASARRYINNIFLFEIIFNFASGLIRLHKVEYAKYGDEKWINSITSLAKYRGTQVDTDYAEAFYVMKYLLK